MLLIKARKQLTSWSCGPAALRTIFNYYKIKVSEKELILLGDIGREGTDFQTMKNLAKDFEFSFYSKSNGSLEGIKKFLKEGYPVLVCYQMGNNKSGHNGHYSVMYDIDDSFVYIADPSNWVEGDRKKYSKNIKMRKTTFLEHWWDTDADLPTGKVIGWYGVLKPKEIL